jgi:hypothetical protein
VEDAVVAQHAALKEQAQHLHDVERLYALEHPEEIRSFLHKRPHVVDLLLEALDPIEHYFGNTATADLKLSIDHDSDSEEGDFLCAIIHSALSLDQALKALDAFDWQWWLVRVPRTDGSLTFDIDL